MSEPGGRRAPFLSAPSISTSTSRWKHIPFENASASSAYGSDVDDASPRRAHCGQRTPTHANPIRTFSLRTRGRGAGSDVGVAGDVGAAGASHLEDEQLEARSVEDELHDGAQPPLALE